MTISTPLPAMAPPGSNISPRKRLPIGIQNLRELREEGHYYADKSGYAVDLAQGGKYYFLSRPRRFGKSLFLDTLKELFEATPRCSKGWPLKPGGTGANHTRSFASALAQGC